MVTVSKIIAHTIFTSYMLLMELTYPINFVGFEDDNTSGEVITRDGEYLGKWVLIKDEDMNAGAFHFIPDGEEEPLFIESIGVLSSGLRTGMALSTICRSIGDWFEEEPKA